MKKETFFSICVHYFNWVLLSFVPLLCPPTISVQEAVVNPRKKKKIVVLNEIFMCGCLSIRVKQISTLFSSEWERDHVSDVTNYHRAPQSSFWIFTSNCYFGGTIGLNGLKRQWCQMCGVIKRSEITSRWAEKEALFPSQGNSAFEFCSHRRRKHPSLSGQRCSWVWKAAETGTSMGALIWLQQVKCLLFTLILTQNHTSTPGRATQRHILQAHRDANVIWIKDF